MFLPANKGEFEDIINELSSHASSITQVVGGRKYSEFTKVRQRKEVVSVLRIYVEFVNSLSVSILNHNIVRNVLGCIWKEIYTFLPFFTPLAMAEYHSSKESQKLYLYVTLLGKVVTPSGEKFKPAQRDMIDIPMKFMSIHKYIGVIEEDMSPIYSIFNSLQEQFDRHLQGYQRVYEEMRANRREMVGLHVNMDVDLSINNIH